MADIHQIIATINPGLYFDLDSDIPDIYSKYDPIDVKNKKLKEYIQKEGFSKAAEKAKSKPLVQHKIVYDSSSETLEPIYFYLLDLMGDLGLKPEKLVDNFTSSPGSGHFSELGQRATVMQQQATKILGDINNVVRSILNLVYDLKEFKIRLATYDDLKSKNKDTREAALLSLKQIWMDRVDINKGNSSIKGMAVSGQVGYQTLIDAFLFVQDESLKVPGGEGEIDLNDRIKRVIRQRIHEFKLWLTESEKELRKRYDLERKYLASQVNSAKIYARWAKPYLKSAQQLEMKESHSPALVKAFNTIVFELALIGARKVNLLSSVQELKIPKDILKLEKKGSIKRDYSEVVIIEFNFRGIPTKTSAYQSHYVFGGKVDITFTGYALNSEELKKAKSEMEKSELGDALKLIEGATENIETLQQDIDMFLKEEEKKQKEEKPKDTSNPFAALLGLYNKKEPEPKKDKSEEKIKSDDFVEKNYIRPLANDAVVKTVFTLFDVYKKAHGMPSYEPREGDKSK